MRLPDFPLGREGAPIEQMFNYKDCITLAKNTSKRWTCITKDGIVKNVRGKTNNQEERKMTQTNAETWEEAQDLAKEFHKYGYQTIVIPVEKAIQTTSKTAFSYKIMVVA